MQIKKDGKGQLYIEWQQAAGGYKRAWVQHREPDRDWANTPEGRYLNVVRIAELGAGPAGNATDFPILAPFLMNRSSLLLLPLFLRLLVVLSRMNNSYATEHDLVGIWNYTVRAFGADLNHELRSCFDISRISV